MTDISKANNSSHRQRVYRFWGRHPTLYWAFDWPVFAGSRADMRQQAIDALELRGGEHVVEIACGPGVNLAPVRQAIGPNGTLTAIDATDAMVVAAREQVRTNGWRNIEILRADAANHNLPAESFDAALCVLGLSVIPEHNQAIARIRTSLRNGGRFVVLDSGHGPLRGRARVLNPILKPLSKLLYDADVDRDIAGDLRRAFDRVDVVEFKSGGLFIATAHKHSTASPPAAPRAVD